MNPINVSNLSEEAIAKIFIDYVSSSSITDLKKSYVNDVVDNEVSQKLIGKFRLIHVFDVKEEGYLTFTVDFYKENNVFKMEVLNFEKKSTILQLVNDPTKNSWASNILYPNIKLSSVTCSDLVVKLKSIL